MFEYWFEYPSARLNFSLQHITVSVNIDFLSCNFCFYRSSCNCGSNMIENSSICWLWDNIIRTKSKVCHPVSIFNLFCNRASCQLSKSFTSSNHHLVINSFCSYIQSSSEYKRETQNIVNLIWKVRPSSPNNCIWSCFFGQVVRNFRIWICHRKNDWVFVHLFYHFWGDSVFNRNTQEAISPIQSIS